MTLSPSNLTSLANELSRWETAEYICAGLVTIACIGEYAAHFTSWLTGGIAERKDRLAKHSTLILAAALSFEIICLVETNALSRKLLGSVYDQAEDAGKKARRAVEDSTAAMAQSGQAKADASDALALARAGRREVDAFAHDVVSAKKQTAEAELALATIKDDRVITPAARKRLEDELARFKGMKFDLAAFKDSESIALMSSLREILASPKVGWIQIPNAGKFWLTNLNPKVGITLFNGVEVEIDNSRAEWKPVVAAIVRVLQQDGIATEGVNAVCPKDAIHIIVGSKPRTRW